MTQSSNPKDKDEAGLSARAGSPSKNTRTTTVQTQPSERNAVPKWSRRTPTKTRAGS
jgi:hypothetical protein